jgi:transposase
VAERRKQWSRRTAHFDPSGLVFVDETGSRTNMTPLYGRNFGGERLVDKTPCGRWETTTLIGALRLDATTACMTMDGAMDGIAFMAYIKNFLCPTLRPGDIVIMDNLSSHSVQGVIEAIETCGAKVCFLPPYSPDFNPIEKMWSKIKQHLKRTKARSKETLLDAIAQALAKVTATDAQGWFTSCGYAN